MFEMPMGVPPFFRAQNYTKAFIPANTINTILQETGQEAVNDRFSGEQEKEIARILWHAATRLTGTRMLFYAAPARK